MNHQVLQVIYEYNFNWKIYFLAIITSVPIKIIDNLGQAGFGHVIHAVFSFQLAFDPTLINSIIGKLRIIGL